MAGRKAGSKNKDRGYRPPGAVARNPGVVRCLAPEQPEHSFLSSDRVNDRLCPRCRDRMESNPEKYSVPPIFLHPVPTPKDCRR